MCLSAAAGAGVVTLALSATIIILYRSCVMLAGKSSTNSSSTSYPDAPFESPTGSSSIQASSAPTLAELNSDCTPLLLTSDNNLDQYLHSYNSTAFERSLNGLLPPYQFSNVTPPYKP